MYWRLAKLGYSVLGVQSFNKDWFRLGEAPKLLANLVSEGFFDRFDKVLFVGASMGGFGALNYASVVSGATVLAFSPQTTMNREIAPFETRFKYRVNRTDWVAPEHLDAAKAVPDLGPVFLVYDPMFQRTKHMLRDCRPIMSYR
jgi:esterase/lipase